MRSVPHDYGLDDSDLSARGRIVSAALEHFATDGFRATTIRAIAATAGVSGALVIHHFGGKDELRRECDERVINFIAGKASHASSDIPEVEAVLTAAAHPFGPYIARLLSETGHASNELFDRLLDTARETVAAGIASGTMRDSTDREALAAAIVALGIAPFFLAHQLARWSGGDTLTGISRVTGPISDIYARGLTVNVDARDTLPEGNRS